MGWVIAGKENGALPEVGRVYEVRSSRKGTFSGRVLEVRDDFADFEVTEGRARFISTENRISDNLREGRGEAQVVTVRDSLVLLIEVHDGE